MNRFTYDIRECLIEALPSGDVKSWHIGLGGTRHVSGFSLRFPPHSAATPGVSPGVHLPRISR